MKEPNPSAIHLHFILGLGRSGTTLLNTMLGSHPGVVATPENDLLLIGYKKFLHKTYWTQRDLDEFFDLLWYKKQNDLRLWKINKDELYTAMKSKLPHTDYLSLCKQVYLHSFSAIQKKSIHTIIDKNPHNLRYFETIKKIAPQSKFILLTRDYRASVPSRILRKIEPIQHPLFYAKSWQIYHQKAQQILEQHKENVLHLTYEKLVQNPEKELRTICAFLNIDFHTDMMNYDENFKEFKSKIEKRLEEDIRHKSDFSHPHLSEKTRTDINKTRISQLSKKDIAEIESICGETGHHFGYKRTSEGNSSSLKSMFYSFLSRFWNLILAQYYHTPLWLRKLFFKIRGTKKIA